MQLSNAAALPPAPASAAWRSQSVASILKEFVVVLVVALVVFAVEPLALVDGGLGVEVCGAQAGNNNSNNMSDLDIMVHPPGIAIERHTVRFALAMSCRFSQFTSFRRPR
jgi:hypothetical protein